MCEYALDHGWKSYRGHQIFQWLYRNRVFVIDEMTNVSKETREILKKDFIVNPLELIKKQVSHDGTTKCTTHITSNLTRNTYTSSIVKDHHNTF